MSQKKFLAECQLGQGRGQKKTVICLAISAISQDIELKIKKESLKLQKINKKIFSRWP